ncbi:chromate efflux transporter [Paenibacillus sp. YYML68]|uniref:chromate efflux transporter n=1 Tax=Paenibacillus sp. YYML68 TaxID=2909250 RepID=UPI0024913097|nr:chromate efflux transporter [Paenibacillus sp. YYML68]
MSEIRTDQKSRVEGGDAGLRLQTDKAGAVDPVEALSDSRSRLGGLGEIFAVSLKLGLTSFGGPIAHLGYFRDEYVRRRQWLSEAAYAELVALSQFLPGPASSQTGIGIGLLRGGLLGGLTAWLGFTLPSVVALVLFAAWAQATPGAMEAGWLHGLKLVAVAVVAQAVLGMAGKLAAGRTRATLALGAAATVLLWPGAIGQLVVLTAAGLYGWWRGQEHLGAAGGAEGKPLASGVSRRTGAAALGAFFVLLAALPLVRQAAGDTQPLLALFDSMYRAGSLVFGGGHVVLPLLEREVVQAGWLTESQFLAGYGATQAVPGPLFTFASYIGMAGFGLAGAAVATLAIFLPAFLLVLGVLPFWESLRTRPRLQGTVAAMNAAVVGLLGAALYDPIWTSTVMNGYDAAFVLVLFGLIQWWKTPPWVIVVLGIAAGWGWSSLSSLSSTLGLVS